MIRRTLPSPYPPSTLSRNVHLRHTGTQINATPLGEASHDARSVGGNSSYDSTSAAS